MLQLYIELEQLRFDHLFNAEINIPKNIDAAFIFIPPLLTQPYIENAIVHGLCNKKEPGGLLKIDYAMENDSILVCTIEDNGIGRAKAQQLALTKSEMHKSMGMQVTKERFDMLAKNKKQDFSTVITDLYHQNGEAAGTRITLRITTSEDEEDKIM
jgi:LytS/YehU family sensor histidine kinase